MSRPSPRQPTSRRAERRPRAVAPAACPAGDVVWAYLDADLPPARARTIAAHVRDCARCHARARRLQGVLLTCRTAGCQALPADVRAGAKARVRALIRGR